MAPGSGFEFPDDTDAPEEAEPPVPVRCEGLAAEDVDVFAPDEGAVTGVVAVAATVDDAGSVSAVTIFGRSLARGDGPAGEDMANAPTLIAASSVSAVTMSRAVRRIGVPILTSAVCCRWHSPTRG